MIWIETWWQISCPLLAILGLTLTVGLGWIHMKYVSMIIGTLLVYHFE